MFLSILICDFERQKTVSDETLKSMIEVFKTSLCFLKYEKKVER